MAAASDTLVNAYSGGTSYTAAYQTSYDDHRTANLVRALFYRARDVRRPIVQQWKKNYRVLNGKLWAPQAEAWMPSPELLQMWPIIAARNAWMTDQRPTLEVMPSAVPFSEYADFYGQLGQQMNATLAAVLSNNMLDGEIGKVLWDVDTYGIGYLKTQWEPWLADGLGDTVFRRKSPYDIYPDPWARSDDQLNYIIEHQVMTVDDLDRAFPGARQKVSAGFTEDYEETPHKLDSTVTSVMGRINHGPLAPGTKTWTGGSGASPRAGSAMITESPVVSLLSCWVRSYKHEKTSTSDEVEGPQSSTKTIESWRCIVVCGNTVLLDELAEDINAFNTHPYDRIVAQDTGEWYGPCLVEMLTSAQESINRTLAAIEFNIQLHGNPMLRESPHAASRNRRVTNRPGQRLEGSNDQIGWLNPPQMHPQMAVELMKFYKSEMESISGMSAIVRGFQPQGRNSEGVLDSVQDAAFVRIRATLREIERTLKGVGMKMVANIAEFYTEPRLITILGQDGQRFTIALRANNFYVPTTEKGDKVPLRFSLMADVGSALATSRQARSAEADRLFAMGAIDVFEVLKAKGWPNWLNVGNRIAQQQAQAGVFGQAPGARAATGRAA